MSTDHAFAGPAGGEPAARPAAAWPPPGVELAHSLFPERAGDDVPALERWCQARLQRWRGGHGARAERRFLAAVERERQALLPLGDAALRRAAREAAKASFGVLDARSGARALAALALAAQRTLGLQPHRPQLLGCWRMVQGRLIELDTGEGKTLTAALAASFAALAGVPVHVVTVNDYLAQRDAELMAPLFGWLDLTVGVVHAQVSQEQRAAQYAHPVTYCTNKDLAFDYLRDRVTAGGLRALAQLAVRQLHGTLKLSEALRLRGLHFAIVDEADSVLVDEARTPLILSALHEADGDGSLYRELLEVARALEEGCHYRLHAAEGRLELLPAGEGRLAEIAAQREQEQGGGAVVQRAREDGESADAAGDMRALWRSAWMREHYVLQALRALHLFRRDQHYVVNEGKVVIVDEFTGRMLPDRSWEGGLHQLVEAKEGCAPSGHNVTLARITYQTFFSRYLRLAGMSGTIRETAPEMAAVLGIDCRRIEPAQPSRRLTLPPRLLPDAAAKARGVVQEVREQLAAGRAVLVGTRSVRASLELSRALAAAGIEHRLLNALQNADEAMLVAQAGQAGAVTVATNMAGRGTDIRLAAEVVAAGGLHVVLTEWHESSRIDRQLYGRCARQGDPGSVRAIVALDDELIQRHAAPAVLGLLSRLGNEAGGWPAWAVQALRRHVQRRAEEANARQRRHTLKQDRQMRRQLAFSGAEE